VLMSDDTTLCFKSKTKSELEITAFSGLNGCIQYFSGVRLNSSKSTYLDFCQRQQDESYQPNVIVDDALLEEADSTKFLGMHLDRGLTWDDHIEAICAKASSGMYALWSLLRYCSKEVLRMAYFGLVYPHLAYGIRIWGSCSAKMQKRHAKSKNARAKMPSGILVF
jgi:hypothetical protein